MKKRVKRHAVVQPLNESYRFIPLTQGQNAIVDTEDFEWLDQWNWYAQWCPSTKSFYAIRQEFRNRIAMHGTILGCNAGDHWNHNTLDNRRRNLRKATHSLNAANAKRHIDSISGFKGVSWRMERSKWKARIRVRGRLKYLGLFTSAQDAAKAYDRAAEIYFGEFAHLNFK